MELQWGEQEIFVFYTQAQSTHIGKPKTKKILNPTARGIPGTPFIEKK